MDTRRAFQLMLCPPRFSQRGLDSLVVSIISSPFHRINYNQDRTLITSKFYFSPENLGISKILCDDYLNERRGERSLFPFVRKKRRKEPRYLFKILNFTSVPYRCERTKLKSFTPSSSLKANTSSLNNDSCTDRVP